MPAPLTRRRRPVLAWLGVVLTACVLPGAALGALPATALGKVVSYRGYRVSVPAGWPVFRLSPRSTTCVRFDRHAVYLGRAGVAQRCPSHAAGRTEAISVSPLDGNPSGGAAAALLTPAATPRAVPAGGSAARIVNPAHRVVVTATWGHAPAVVRRALGVRSLAGAVRAWSDQHPPAARGAHANVVPGEHANAARGAHARGRAAGIAAPPGSVYTGLGFDACSTPSSSAMAAWGASPFRAVGVYIGGANMACSQPNLTAGWVTQQSNDGWHMIPIYVGLQAPANSCGCAAMSAAGAGAQGTAAAHDAIVHAQAVGLGQGNPIYFDLEAYNPGPSTSAAVLTFLSAWTAQLHASGYKSGVYSSGGSGIRDLVARYGTGYGEPDDIWVADWNGSQSTSDPYLPGADWPSHQRLHQFEGAHTDTYGGAAINIDGDYVDASTASTGAVTTSSSVAASPSVSVAPAGDGTIGLYPRWSGATGVSSWQVLAGANPSSLTPATGPVRVAARLPIMIRSAYRYFQVRALGSTGQTVGSSSIVATPAHVAIFGRSAFVPRRGKGGLPVGCFDGASCVMTTTITQGRRTLTRTRAERVAAGGGIAYFGLPAAVHRAVATAAHHRLAVEVTVRSSSGATARRQINLVPYVKSGRAPRHSLRSSSAVRIVGGTDFVSNAWSGGILAACLSSAPCSTTTTLTAGGRTIATTARETLGAGEVGYLPFTLNATGHNLLRRARGNQLAVGLRITTPQTATSASGQIELAAF